MSHRTRSPFEVPGLSRSPLIQGFLPVSHNLLDKGVTLLPVEGYNNQASLLKTLLGSVAERLKAPPC